MPNEVVEKYRLEGDTSGASAAVKKFEAEHDKSLSAVERKAKIAAIEQEAAAERAAAAQTAAANKAAAAQEKAMQKAMISVELFKQGMNLAIRAVASFGRAAMEYEKGLVEQDRVVTHLTTAWGDLWNAAAGLGAQSVGGVLVDLTDDAKALTRALKEGNWEMGAMAALQTALPYGKQKEVREYARGSFGDFNAEEARADLGIDDAGLAAAKERERKQEQAADKERRRREKAKDDWVRANQEHEKDWMAEIHAHEAADAKATEDVESKKSKIVEDNEERRMDAIKRGEAWQEKQREASLRKFEKDQQERQRIMEENAQDASEVATTIAGTFAEGIDSVVEGGTLGFGKFLAGLGRTIGTMLIGRGAADVSMGNATSANIYTPGMGIPQTTMGGIELALGSAMLVGGMAAGAAMSGATAGGGSGGAGSAGSTFAPTQQTPETITVNLTTLGKWGQSEHSAFQRQLGGALGRRYR